MNTPSSTGARHPTLRHLEQLMGQLLDGVILIDATGTILSANAAALRMHGVDAVEELGGTAEGYAERFSLRGESRRPLKHREYPLFRLLAGDSFPDLVVEVAPAGEETRWVHQVRDVVMDEDGGEPDYLALVISDVSERFDAEARFTAMFRANPAPALVIRLRDQRIVQANPGFLDLTGYAPERLIGRTLFGLDLLQGMHDPAAVRARIDAGEIVSQAEAELLVADGSKRLVLFAGQPIDVTDEDALLLTFADLEPRRQAQNALAASERHLAAVFEMAPVAMAVTRDADHRVASVNNAFRQLTGYDNGEAIGRTGDELRLWEHAEDRATAEREVEEQQGVVNREGRLLTKAGAPVDCLVSAETISMHGTPCVLWVYQDITERRRSELELVEAIDEVMKDASWLSRSIMDKLATIRRPGPAKPAIDLSPREREILELICDDLDDTHIAERLSLSRNTVRNHVARLYAKIGVNRRSGAVIWGRERGLGRLGDPVQRP
jgi:PAS domain S-box-containing protein